MGHLWYDFQDRADIVEEGMERLEGTKKWGRRQWVYLPNTVWTWTLLLWTFSRCDSRMLCVKKCRMGGDQREGKVWKLAYIRRTDRPAGEAHLLGVPEGMGWQILCEHLWGHWAFTFANRGLPRTRASTSGPCSCSSRRCRRRRLTGSTTSPSAQLRFTMKSSGGPGLELGIQVTCLADVTFCLSGTEIMSSHWPVI